MLAGMRQEVVNTVTYWRDGRVTIEHSDARWNDRLLVPLKDWVAMRDRIADPMQPLPRHRSLVLLK